MTVPLRFSAPAIRPLSGGRLHLHHGPIDVVLKAWGEPEAVGAAYRAVEAAFGPVLARLTDDLPRLRRPSADPGRVEGPVALRMLAATRLFPDHFVTPMAAVAGAVADHLMDAMLAAAPLHRAFVNDGGDISLFLAPGETMTVALAGHADAGHVARFGDVRMDIAGRSGIATSGRHGRSFSFGIADAVTAIAADAATADAAATLIANTVDIDSPAIRRAPASGLDPDSDLGDLPVTVEVGPLTPAERDSALAAGRQTAERFHAAGRIRAAALLLGGSVLTVGPWPAAAAGLADTKA